MPPGNVTEMTGEERGQIVAWLAAPAQWFIAPRLAQRMMTIF
jgi:hypothetical protein